MNKTVKVYNKNNGEAPNHRNHWTWTSSFINKIFGRGSTVLKFKSMGSYDSVELQGVNVSKRDEGFEMDKARLMKHNKDEFFFLVDMETHGVNWFSRKRGGHKLFVIQRKEKGSRNWNVTTHYYSRNDTAHLGLGRLKNFFHVYWRIVKGCYYDVALKEQSGGDNSS